MFDLNAEMNGGTDACPPSRITTAGLDWEACMWAGAIGVVYAETHRDGTYQPFDEGGRLLWCVQAFHGPVSPEPLVDLVAWRPGNSYRWWGRTGHAEVLGCGNVLRARASVFDFGDVDLPEPPTLDLRATPRDYALAGFTGACILDWRHGIGELERNRSPMLGVLVGENFSSFEAA